MAWRVLPNEPPPISRSTPLTTHGNRRSKILTGGPLYDPCTICGEPGPQVQYFYLAGRVVSVHAACDALWKQERGRQGGSHGAGDPARWAFLPMDRPSLVWTAFGRDHRCTNHGAPGVTRTPGPQFRKLLLYPPELRGRPRPSQRQHSSTAQNRSPASMPRAAIRRRSRARAAASIWRTRSRVTPSWRPMLSSVLRLLAGEAEAQLQHAALGVGQIPEHAGEVLARLERRGEPGAGQGLGVLDEILDACRRPPAPMGASSETGTLAHALDVLDLLERLTERLGDLFRGRRATQVAG